MLPNLRHLQVFREAARRGSLSAASRAVHISQPAATQALAGVERYFGATLFDRGSSGMTLNAAGGVCLERVERALEHLREGIATEAPREPGRESATPPRGIRGITATQLHILLAVVEHRGFGRAARARGLSRPTVHRAARQLERAMAAELFERTSFGLQPTREAEKLARRVQLAFGELTQARGELSELEGGNVGSTVIGALPLARSFLVPKAVIEFSAQHPQHSVSILDGPYETLLGALRSGTADFLIGALRQPLPDPEVRQEHLFDDPLAIIVRRGHPLTRSKTLSARDLSRFPWVAPRPDAPLRRHFDALFAGARTRAAARPIECNSLVAARAILLESDHAMLLSARQVHYEIAAGLLVALRHPGGNVARPIGLTVRRDWRPTAAQRRLLEIVKATAQNPARQLRVRLGT